MVETYVFCSNTFCKNLIFTIPGYTEDEFRKKCINDNYAWTICKKCLEEWVKPALKAGYVEIHTVKNVRTEDLR